MRVRRKGAAESEVSQFDASVGGEEDVGGFDVAMHHTRLVHVLHALAHLSKVPPDLYLAQRDARLSRTSEQPPEVAMLGPLEDDVEFVVVDEGGHVLDDARVRRQRLQQLHFLEAALA